MRKRSARNHQLEPPDGQAGPSWASGVDLVVEGANFDPRILEDMERAQSSIHVIQSGFRPGKVGDRLTDVLARKARAGVAVRIWVDANGSDTGGASRPMFRRLALPASRWWCTTA